MKFSKLNKICGIPVLCFLFLSFFASSAAAYVIEKIADTPVRGDFVLTPAKQELVLEPGSSVAREIVIMNRAGRDLLFSVETEDFTGSRDTNQAVVLLGGERGPYSLKDYVRPELKSFVLSHGQRIDLPVVISIPKDAEPGGLYGSVLVSAQSAPAGQGTGSGEAAGGAVVLTRLGVLYFVRVSGPVEENGSLKKFDTELNRRFFEKGPVSFEILFENSGNVYLAPYGSIEITDMLGRPAGAVEISPWFVLPDSLRARDVNWEKGSLFGRYTARLKVNRGYGNLVDEMATTFWVLPWKPAFLVLTVLAFGIWGFWKLFSRFVIKRKFSS